MTRIGSETNALPLFITPLPEDCVAGALVVGENPPDCAIMSLGDPPVFTPEEPLEEPPVLPPDDPPTASVGVGTVLSLTLIVAGPSPPRVVMEEITDIRVWEEAMVVLAGVASVVGAGAVVSGSVGAET